MPHPGQRPPRKARRKIATRFTRGAPIVLSIFFLAVTLFSLPSILAIDLKVKSTLATNAPATDFPISVNPKTKTIIENPAVDDFLKSTEPSPLSAAVFNAAYLFTWLASQISSLSAYQSVASVIGSDTIIVNILPGERQEQVADAFGSKLHWSTKTRQLFISHARTHPPTLSEGQFVPGTYAVSALATPTEVQAVLYDRFTEDIASRYSTTTAQLVPVSEALTVASLLQREAAGPEDMRLISGIIWNRIFLGMNLQIDATLQYAKATNTNTKSWWPTVVPKDKYIKSAYNTYLHAGLPPGPISNAPVAAVIAALNPRKTDCLFYFHDKYGNFHCSKTYAGHVALLKKYYGQGK